MSTTVDLGTDALPRKARPIALDPGMTATRAFVVVATECVEHWRTNEALLVHSRAMPHLHQTRVGIRRLRSAVSLFGPVLERHSPVVAAAHRIRELALPFGHARDLDVLLAGDILDGRHEREVVGLWGARQAAYDEVLHVLGCQAVGQGQWRPRPGTRGGAVAAGRRPTRRRPRGRSPRQALAPRRRQARRDRRRCPRRSGTGCASRPRSCATAASSSPPSYPDGADAGHAPRVVTSTGEVLTGPLAYAWYVEDVQSTLGAVNDHHIADTLLRSVGGGAPEVDEEALVEAGIRACERLAAIDPFWH